MNYKSLFSYILVIMSSILLLKYNIRTFFVFIGFSSQSVLVFILMALVKASGIFLAQAQYGALL